MIQFLYLIKTYICKKNKMKVNKSIVSIIVIIQFAN